MCLPILLSSAQCLWQIYSLSVTSMSQVASHHSNMGVWEEREQNKGSNLLPFFYIQRICVCPGPQKWGTDYLLLSYWLRVDANLMA